MIYAFNGYNGEISSAINQLANANFNSLIHIPSKDEFGDIARDINLASLITASFGELYDDKVMTSEPADIGKQMFCSALLQSPADLTLLIADILLAPKSISYSPAVISICCCSLKTTFMSPIEH